jgi:hypothetical protein
MHLVGMGLSGTEGDKGGRVYELKGPSWATWLGFGSLIPRRIRGDSSIRASPRNRAALSDGD